MSVRIKRPVVFSLVLTKKPFRAYRGESGDALRARLMREDSTREIAG